MALPIIEVTGLSKRYRLGSIGPLSLRETANRWWDRVRGSGAAPEKGEFWALREVSFAVQPGEVLGVIGRNGAGKSTLLKILSRITEPTAGRAVIRGRVASLLEVGTGFHPELTGRENIFLNGAILGMSRAEVRRKFDEIVDFSEVHQFIDTPVKRYSSGMYVRLAFAVAAHLEPEILIVDEVLAVGDAQFQQKCLGKMQNVATGGRTVIFVSHNEAAVRRLCSRAILLENGRLTFAGSPADTFQKYKAGKQTGGFSDQKRVSRSDKVRITDACLRIQGLAETEFLAGIHPELEISVTVASAVSFAFEALLRDANSQPIMFAPVGLVQGFQRQFAPGKYRLKLELKFPFLAEGVYSLDLIIGEPGQAAMDCLEDALVFTVLPSANQVTGWVFHQARGQGSALLETGAPIVESDVPGSSF